MDRFNLVYRSDKQKAIREMIRVANPGTKIVIADETEKGARWYERFPCFRLLFQGKRETVTAPLDLDPQDMEDARVDKIWRGLGPKTLVQLDADLKIDSS